MTLPLKKFQEIALQGLMDIHTAGRPETVCCFLTAYLPKAPS